MSCWGEGDSALVMCGSSVTGCADLLCVFTRPDPLLISRLVWDPGALSRVPERSPARSSPQC